MFQSRHKTTATQTGNREAVLSWLSRIQMTGLVEQTQ